MHRYLFGMDTARPGDCARALKAAGIDAVVLGQAAPEVCAALAEQGIELWLCFGAFSLSRDADPSRLCRDAFGTRRRWFGSGCPSDRSLFARDLERALVALRRTPSARGLFADGARFASFASPEGAEAFFTGFCPRCEAEMAAMGLDPAAVAASVRRLAEGELLSSGDLPLLRDWLSFREAVVRETFDTFVRSVHSLPGTPQAGAFVFPPSLGRFVGQTPASLRAPDVLAPMLYRAWPGAEGPACLNHEWASGLRLLGEKGLQALGAEDVPEGPPERLLAEGFPPERVGRETALAARDLREGQRLAPILQLKDDRAEASARAALSAGAEAVGWFAWDGSAVPEIEESEGRPREAGS